VNSDRKKGGGGEEREKMSRPNDLANWLAYSRDPKFECHLTGWLS